MQYMSNQNYLCSDTMTNHFQKFFQGLEHRLTQLLFRYRVTPQTTAGLSPAQLLMDRRLRTTLDLLHPDTSKRVEDKQ